MKKLLLVSLILGLVGCGEDECISMAKNAVAAQLKDPSSAQFRNFKTSSTGSVCGEVNAKNSFGAYTGFVSFYYVCSREAPENNYLSMDTNGKLKEFADNHGVGSIISCD